MKIAKEAHRLDDRSSMLLPIVRFQILDAPSFKSRWTTESNMCVYSLSKDNAPPRTAVSRGQKQTDFAEKFTIMTVPSCTMCEGSATEFFNHATEIIADKN